jgi:hypothetical protein
MSVSNFETQELEILYRFWDGAPNSPSSELIHRNANLAVAGTVRGLARGRPCAGINGERISAINGGTHDGSRAGLSIDGRIIRALVRGYFRVLVCGQIAA